MRKFISLFLLSIIFYGGCATANIPNYLKDNKPYKNNFFTDFDTAYKSVVQALEELGWKISGTADPYVFEQIPANSREEGKKILLFTEIRQTPFFLGTRYAKMNVYIRSVKDTTEIEIRYLTISSLPLKNIQSYRNDSAVQRIFARITELIEK